MGTFAAPFTLDSSVGGSEVVELSRSDSRLCTPMDHDFVPMPSEVALSSMSLHLYGSYFGEPQIYP